MPFFGQVWVWSLAGFLVGALLCWALIANPARKRAADLERKLAAVRRRRPEPLPEPDEDDRRDFSDGVFTGGVTDSDFDQTEFRHSDFDSDEPAAEVQDDRGRFEDYLDSREDGSAGRDAGHYDEDDEAAQRGSLVLSDHLVEPSAAAEQQAAVATTQYLPALATPEPAADDGLVDDLADAPAQADDDEYDDGQGTVFTQRTTPIPAELIRRIDAEGKTARVPAVEDSALVDDLDDDLDEVLADDLPDLAGDRATDDRGYEGSPEERATDEQAAPQRLAEPTQVFRPVADEPAAPEPAHAHAGASSAAGQATGFLQPQEPAPGQAQPERTHSVLPKRIPSKPQNRFPFGVQTTPTESAPPAPPPPPAAQSQAQPEIPPLPDEPVRERSLFEPVLAADEAPVAAKPAAAPPPHRFRGARSFQQSPTGVDSFVSPGPFGPGSAMPLPGGQSPSSEYTIKASVTALRYCSPESPKFDRTVAEVWFRSVADAERVGFRPLA